MAGEGRGHPSVTAENKLRTIIEREKMLPRCARRAQQQIRLHEVTRTQGRRLALELYKNNTYPAVISARSVHTVSQNVPLVTRRKCSSTTEYLLSYKACIERNDGAPSGCVQ